MMRRLLLLFFAVAIPALAGWSQDAQQNDVQKNVATVAPAAPAAAAPAKVFGGESELPTWQLGIGYQFNDIHLHNQQAGQANGFHTSGFNIAGAHFFNSWFALEAQAGFGFGSTGTSTIPNGLAVRTLFLGGGPKISYRSNSRVEPWGHGLAGLEHFQFTQTATLGSESTVGWLAGAGVDIHVSPSVAIRLESDYLGTQLFGMSHRNYQAVGGIVFSVGGNPPAPPLPPPPVNPSASCTADKSSVFAGSGDQVGVVAQASDPGGSALSYSWTASGGSVDGTGPQVRWRSAGLAPGSYTVMATVSNGRGGEAMCSVNETVAVRPDRPPTVSVTSDRESAFVGEKVQFTAQGTDPDGDPLTYTWRTTCGQLSGTGATNALDTTGAAPGVCTVTVRVDDGRGGAADASKSVNVQAPPPPPQASKMNSCDFKPATSVRVDNVCKRILDDVGLRLQNEPRANAVIVGFADPGPRATKMAGDRATNIVKYLTDKGVDAARVTTRAGAGQAGAKDNSRIDIIWVPEGATY